MFDESFFEMYNQDNDEEESSAATTTSQIERTVESIDSSKIFVLSIGGSIIANDKPNSTYIAKLSETLTKLEQEGYRFVLVIGGGAIARNYMASAKSLGANNFEQDQIGIFSSRLNAMVVIRGVVNSYPSVLKKIEESKTILQNGKIPVFGGILPGATTDFVGALIAEYLQATFINMSNVDGVYSSDPTDNPRAKLFTEISYEKLLSLMKLHSSSPGPHVIMDVPACLVIKRSKIPTLVIDGNDLENFENAVHGTDFKGTIVGSFEQED